jgi:hypothetical protein
MIPTDPDVLLRRAATAEALTEVGYPTSTATLASMAVRGGGPIYQCYGRIPLYRWGNALAWAQNRMSAPRYTTSLFLKSGEPEMSAPRYTTSLFLKSGEPETASA